MAHGIFWIVDDGAKWQDLPAEFGPKLTVHDWFCRWAAAAAFERILRKADQLPPPGPDPPVVKTSSWLPE